ncbi:MAG: DUF2760 domain-containing protein [Gemmataceae bacterium]|nr:DUF2760 domain-containing protein [Gemmataceae bacterium]
MLDNPWVIVLLTILGIGVLRLLLALALAGGDFGRVKLAIRGSLRILRDPAFAAKVKDLLDPPPPAPPPKPSGAPLRLLVVLQRDGRLVDFLLEDLSALSDDQVVTAVRDIQPKCRKSLQEHLVLEPVLSGEENETVEVAPGFDPSAIQLVGNVTGQPPFRGALHHPGWRVKEIKVAAPAKGQDEFVLQPAEVGLP